MTGTQNIGEDGFINQTTGETKGDYAAWCSVGPWRNFQNGQSVSATVAFAVSEGTFQKASKYSQDYLRYFNHRFDPNANYGIARI